MNKNNKTSPDSPDSVAIEHQLPLTAIDIESQKDMESGRYHALRSLHKWFAARPTPAVRLAIIASAYPGEISSDYLLKLMQVGPSALDSDIAEFVEEKFKQKKNSRDTLDDHYGYPNPNTQSPSETQLEEFHDQIRDAWGGELPTILDPTAGRGTIPFEALRYGFPVKANELNPVPTLILRSALNFAPQIGSLTPEIYEYRDEIHNIAKDRINEYYPTKTNGRQILNCALTYIIQCDACSGQVPLVSKWWLNKTSDGGHAVRPLYQDDKVEYEYVFVEDSDEGYDPDDAPVSRGDATCPHCGVVTEQETVREKISREEYEYSIYGVNYEDSNGERGYRAGSDIDKEGMEKAKSRVESDFELLDFLAEPYPGGHTDRVKNYGIQEWRDIFTPRQLVVLFEYYKSYEEIKQKVKEEYQSNKSDAILTILSLAASRALHYNTRLNQWHDLRGYGTHLFTDNNFVLKKMSVDNNLAAPRRGYLNHSEHVIESYETLCEYVRNRDSAEVFSEDAANISNVIKPGSVDIAIVDPPYYSSIMYSELSDVFYVLHKEYLSDIFPELYDSQLTNKKDEAVANPSQFEEFNDSNSSKKEMADNHYEEKMNQIFDSVSDTLNDNGIMTIMFTHRDMDAWDTLTSALIESNFTISATHPIKTEMSDRVGAQGKATADSSILLIARKLTNSNKNSTTLWENIKTDIRNVATDEAENILDSDYSMSKTDTAIAAYGPALQTFASEFPVVDKKGENVRPRKALAEARKVVTSVIAERYLNTAGINKLDDLTRWYILAWLIYENNTMPYDEGRQLGVAANVDVDDIKRPTKIWRGGKEIKLQNHDDRVQNIVFLTDETVEDPSTRKYPVDPTSRNFTYTIDAVHSAIHIYDVEGADAAWDWLTERNMKSDSRFKIAITALLEVLPEDNHMHALLVNLVSGDTGDYLDINLSHIDINNETNQTSLEDHTQ